MQSNDIKISTIIPTHNRADALDLTLEHLAEQDFSEGWEAIVVNNNSTDNTDEIVKIWQEKFPAPLRLVHEKKPGASSTRNRGAKHAKGKYLIFIDNDILTPPDFLRRHNKSLESFSECWIVGQALNLPEQETTVFGKYRKTLYPSLSADAPPTESIGITGQNVSMLRRQFEALGGFDENFHVASGEDRELALRAINSGIKILSDPGNIVFHNDWAGTSIRDFCRRQRIYSQTEPYFWQKYGGVYTRSEMVRKNLPPRFKEDGLKLFVWKNIKRVLGSDTGQSSVIKLCEISEKILPVPVILWKLYRLAIAGAIYRGFQEGLAFYRISGETKTNAMGVKHESSVG